MVSQPLNRTAQAVASSAGLATFTFDSVPQGQVWQGTITILRAPSYALFVASTADISWGSWQGGQAFGPVQIDSRLSLTVLGSLLVPNTTYIATLQGVAAAVGDLPPLAPQPQALPTFTRAPLYDLTYSSATGTGSPAVPPLNPNVSGLADITNFAGVRFHFNNLGAQAVVANISFVDSHTTETLAFREVILAGSGTANYSAREANFQLPAMGDQLQITMPSVPLGNALSNVVIRVSGTNSDRPHWAPQAGGGVNNSPFSDDALAWAGSGSIGAGANKSIPTTFVYGGPISITLSWVTIPTTWGAILFAMKLDGTEAIIGGVDNASGPGANPRALTAYAPSVPLRFQINNTSAGAQIMQGCMVNGDIWR